mmetsp:Transcript_111847/g.249629  ORF Transcript_111847/g.249629 Transcript_111847/m.249629 type:complete len:233 (+) Transcript_111847:320-1018(+)
MIVDTVARLPDLGQIQFAEQFHSPMHRCLATCMPRPMATRSNACSLLMALARLPFVVIASRTSALPLRLLAVKLAVRLLHPRAARTSAGILGLATTKASCLPSAAPRCAPFPRCVASTPIAPLLVDRCFVIGEFVLAWGYHLAAHRVREGPAANLSRMLDPPCGGLPTDLTLHAMPLICKLHQVDVDIVHTPFINFHLASFNGPMEPCRSAWSFLPTFTPIIWCHVAAEAGA